MTSLSHPNAASTGGRRGSIWTDERLDLDQEVSMALRHLKCRKGKKKSIYYSSLKTSLAIAMVWTHSNVFVEYSTPAASSLKYSPAFKCSSNWNIIHSLIYCIFWVHLAKLFLEQLTRAAKRIKTIQIRGESLSCMSKCDKVRRRSLSNDDVLFSYPSLIYIKAKDIVNTFCKCATTVSILLTFDSLVVLYVGMSVCVHICACPSINL